MKINVNVNINVELNVFLFVSIYFTIFVGFYVLTSDVDAVGVKYFREHHLAHTHISNPSDTHMCV